MAGLSALEALIARGPDTSPALMLPWQDAQTEIVKALGITRETALMVLYGLCATANLRCFTADRQIIDTDQGPLVIEGKIAFVEADATSIEPGSLNQSTRDRYRRAPGERSASRREHRMEAILRSCS